MLHIDFETRSPIPISHGAHKYATQAEILCMGYAFDDEDVEVWFPGTEFPERVRDYISDGGDCYAHNAEFEDVIFQACLNWLAPEPYQWVCTATLAAACALPRSLDKLARCLGTRHQKSKRGQELIKLLCIPREDGTYLEDISLLTEMGAYCLQDVETERDCARCMREFMPEERDDFLVNLLINERGIPVDMYLADLAQNYAKDETEDLRSQIEYVSRGDLVKKSGTKLTMWVYERLEPEQKELMHRYKNGVMTITLDKSVRTELLGIQAHIDMDTYRVIECADLASRSSVAKYTAMTNRAQGNRVRGSYLLNGAGQTGRYSAHGLQMHNLPRTSHPDPESVIDAMEANEILPNCMETLSHMLRPAILAEEGKRLVWGDWSAIEGRVLPWLANTIRSRDKLALYHEGVDVYVHTAAAMVGCPLESVTDALRQTGKVAELSLGYAGGAGALHSMGRNYGMSFANEEAERVKNQWRQNNLWAVNFWDVVGQAANNAFHNPGTLCDAGRLAYIYIPEVLMGSLWCRLPSGRMLCYPGVKRMLEPTPWGEEYQLSAIKGSLQPKVGEKEWPRVKLWKGLLAENATQAVAADILRSALRECVLGQDWPVVGHTHDEILLEVHDHSVVEAAKDLKYVMETAPAWAADLPLAVKMGSGERYGK